MSINRIRDAFITGEPLSINDTQVIRYGNEVLLAYHGNVIAKRDTRYDFELLVSWCDAKTLSAVTRRLAPIIKWYMNKTYVYAGTDHGEVILYIGDSEKGKYTFESDDIIHINLSTYELTRTTTYKD